MRRHVRRAGVAALKLGEHVFLKHGELGGPEVRLGEMWSLLLNVARRVISANPVS